MNVIIMTQRSCFVSDSRRCRLQTADLIWVSVSRTVSDRSTQTPQWLLPGAVDNSPQASHDHFRFPVKKKVFLSSE